MDFLPMGSGGFGVLVVLAQRLGALLQGIGRQPSL
jgi:hypothetical protein